MEPPDAPARRAPRPSPLQPEARAAISRLRGAFDHAGYGDSRLLRLLGVETLPPFRRRRRDLATDSPAGRTAIATLARLFLLRKQVSREEVDRAFSPSGTEDAAAAGLIAVGPWGVEATVELSPIENLLVASDWPGEERPDVFEVMGVAASTRALAQLRLRSAVARTLDLGTGGGVLALLAAAHSEDVVATDLNSRALEFARFNARWNGISQVSWREGDLFEPVADETFDRILCNPPFVLSPDVEALHTHSGWPGDSLCRFIVRTAPAHLTREGVCQVACNWAMAPSDDWRRGVSEWLEGVECDAWTLYSHSESADAYAAARVAEGFPRERDEGHRLERWRAYYAHERIDAVAFGIITLRRRRGTGRTLRFDRISDLLPSGLHAGEAAAYLRRLLEEAMTGSLRGSRS